MRTINLIRTTTSGPQLSGEASGVIQKITYGSLLALIVSGLIVGSVFLYVQSVERQRASEKQALVAEVAQNTSKEGLLLSVGQRSTVVSKLLKGARAIRPLFDQFSSIIPFELVQSLSADEGNRIVFSANVATISQMVAVVDALQKSAAQAQIINPELQSLSMSKEGGFIITISFTARL